MTAEPSPVPPAENEIALPPGAVVPPSQPRKSSRRRQVFRALLAVLVLWAMTAYLLMPAFWKRWTRRHPSLEDTPRITHTGSGIHGDPLNVALIGTKPEVMKIMVAAKWYPADPLTFRSSLKIAAASVLKRPYDVAPVSNLYLFERKQDLAFEKPAGNDPRKRHHVRFWLTDKIDPDGRPVWVGAAIFDSRVEFSRTTGQFTHRTAADIDTERDYLFGDLQDTHDLSETYIIQDFHKVREGRNGGGDRWHTDGNLHVGVIGNSSDGEATTD
jgi:hypothetical protein